MRGGPSRGAPHCERGALALLNTRGGHHTMRGEPWPTRGAPQHERGGSWANPNPYMLNMRGEEYNTVFYSDLACFLNTVPLKMEMFVLYTGLTRRNT